MIKSLRLGNFKAFAETQNIPIRPLTLIFGPNSSGKSSIIHGLLFAENALKTKDLDAHRTAIGGESVDLGGFRQYVHKRDVGRRVNFSMDIDIPFVNGRLQEMFPAARTLRMSVDVGLADKTNQKRERVDITTGTLVKIEGPVLVRYEVSVDERVMLTMSRRADNTLQMDNIDAQHPAMKNLLQAIIESATTVTSLDTNDVEILYPIIDKLVPTMKAFGDKLIPDGLVRFAPIDKSMREILYPVSKGRRGEDLAAAMEVYLPRNINELIQIVHGTITNWMQDVRYLGPLRSYPPRHLAFAQYHDPNWVAGGGVAWDVVRRNSDVRKAVNEWLSSSKLQTPYELTLARLVNPTTLGAFLQISKAVDENTDTLETMEGIPVRQVEEENIPELIENVISKLTDPNEVEGLDELVLVDKRTETVVSHRDVGIGISQVLPVLVAAYGSRGFTVAIEQPEIHLHPALQAELGDVFIESALGPKKNTFILETHSEHLILRILRRIRESAEMKTPTITPNDVQILYVQPGSNGSVVIPLEITPDGDFAQKWPSGFFVERAEELF